MTDNKSLHRIFSSSDANKYPTVGKLFSVQNNSNSNASQKTPVSQGRVPVQNKQDDSDLDLLDNLVNQAILSKSQSVDESTPQVGRKTKELLPKDFEVPEVGQGATEQSPEAIEQSAPETTSSPEAAELSKELKEVGKEVKEQREQAEIKDQQQEISDLANSATTPVAVSDEPVVVLPITAKSKEEAKFKSTKYSVRWLWEWCKKVAKMFSGAVIYKEEVDNE